LKIKEESMQGLILDITAHTFGISRALSISPHSCSFREGFNGVFRGYCCSCLY